MSAPSNDNTTPKAALVAAFRGAVEEHSCCGPSENFEDFAHTWWKSTGVAEAELSKVFPADIAEELAEALARAARAIVWGELVFLPDETAIYVPTEKSRAFRAATSWGEV